VYTQVYSDSDITMQVDVSVIVILCLAALIADTKIQRMQYCRKIAPKPTYNVLVRGGRQRLSIKL